MGLPRVYLWFNGECPHSGPLVMNLFHNAVLRNVTGEARSTITLVNAPVISEPQKLQMNFEDEHGKLFTEEIENLFHARNVIIRIVHSFFVSLSTALFAAAHVIVPITERLNGFKHLQLMTGMSGYLYWCGHLFFDAIGAVCSSLLFVAVIIVSPLSLASMYLCEYYERLSVNERLDPYG